MELPTKKVFIGALQVQPGILFAFYTQGQIQIDGKEFDVVCTKFGTTLFIFISEFQKIGTLVS